MDNKVIDKIRKLIKLEESATKVGSIAEAANAAERIRELLQAHNLEMSQISMQEPEKEEAVTSDRFYPEELTKPHEGDWIRSLTEVIGRFNNCRVIGTGKSVGAIYIVGTQTNSQVTWYTVSQLSNRLRPMAKQAWKDYKGFEKRNTFIRGYYIGAVRGIDTKLTEEKERERAQASKDRNNGLENTNALMIVNMDDLMTKKVQSYINANFNVGTRRARTTKSASGWSQGFEAGKSMSINSGVGSSNTVRRLG